MAIPESFIQELISRNDIESVASSYVNFKRRGKNLVGLCPFHGEKTPSFNLYPETSSFYCFGCGAGGDVITFIKRIENLDYVDAIKFLANRSGMQMPEESKQDDRTSHLRMRILEANREAARFFHSQLSTPAGKIALDYYRGRGYTDATIKRFGLGYAPAEWDALGKALRAKGFKDEELQAAFLTRRSKNGGSYDIFRNRVIIPIIDIRGAVVGFGGRVLDDSKPKYINTESTLAYSKSNNLFALNYAKSTGRELILCEGYMDVIAMHQAGFPNAVAALGTSFPEEQVRLIARYADKVSLMFDADEAGQKATRRALDSLRSTGVDVKVVTIPDGKDPDEFIRNNGAERFRLLMERSSNAMEYRLMTLASKYALGTADGKVGYLRDATALLASSSAVEQDVYAGKLSQELGVSKEAILQQIKKNATRRERQEKGQELTRAIRQDVTVLRKVNPEAEKAPRAAQAEEALLGSLLLHPDYIEKALALLPTDGMVTSLGKRIYGYIVERKRQGLLLELAFFSGEFEDAQMAYISKMVQSAKEKPCTPADIERYAAIIREERVLQSANQPENLGNEQIEDILAVIRDRNRRIDT
jgi:DNA primase